MNLYFGVVNSRSMKNNRFEIFKFIFTGWKDDLRFNQYIFYIYNTLYTKINPYNSIDSNLYAIVTGHYTYTCNRRNLRK